MAERMPNVGESAWANIMGANDGSGGFLRVTHEDDGTLRPQMKVVATTALSADQNDWNPTSLSSAGVLEVSTNAIRTITGLTAPTASGRALVLLNAGNFTVQLTHEDTASSAANRFFIGNNAGAGNIFSLWVGSQVWLVYDGSRWRVISNQNPGGATPIVAGTATVGTSPFPSHQDHVHPSEGVASTGYTPTLTQSGAVTKTVTYARYIQVGKLVFVWVYLSVTGSGTTANLVLTGLPVAAEAAGVTANATIGSGEIKIAGTVYPVQFWLNTSTTVGAYRTDTNRTGNIGTSDPNAALANGDRVVGNLMYEAA